MTFLYRKLILTRKNNFRIRNAISNKLFFTLSFGGCPEASSEEFFISLLDFVSNRNTDGIFVLWCSRKWCSRSLWIIQMGCESRYISWKQNPRPSIFFWLQNPKTLKWKIFIFSYHKQLLATFLDIVSRNRDWIMVPFFLTYSQTCSLASSGVNRNLKVKSFVCDPGTFQTAGITGKLIPMWVFTLYSYFLCLLRPLVPNLTLTTQNATEALFKTFQNRKTLNHEIKVSQKSLRNSSMT